MPPTLTNVEQITSYVLRFGNFERTLDHVVKFMETRCSSTLILRGDAGSGKKSLLNEAAEALKGRVKLIHLNPFIDTEDFAALKYIAANLGLKPKISSRELVEDIKGECGNLAQTIVVVLHFFEEFCRKNQSLLYGLTTLTQHGDNFKVIGLTLLTDSTCNLEKRIRSRLNASFLELQLPYSNLTEYLQFASLLVCNRKLDGKLREQLEYNYNSGNRSIRQLKRYLISRCSRDKNNKLVIIEPEEILKDTRTYVDNLVSRLKSLTRPEFELFRLAVRYCDKSETCEFNLKELTTFAVLNHLAKFAHTSNLEHTKVLTKLTLFVKLGSKPITPMTTFACNCTMQELRHIIAQTEEFKSLRGDPIMKRV